MASIRDVATVAGCVNRLWLGELGRQLCGSRALVRVVLVVAAAALTAWQALALVGRISSRSPVPIGDDLQSGLGSEILLVCLVVPALVSTLLFVLAPSRPLVDDMLAPLPVAPIARRLGVDLPLTGVAAGVDVLVLVPIVASGFVLVSPERQAPFAVAAVTFAALGASACSFAFAAADHLSSRLGVAPVVSRVAAALAVLGGCIAAIAVAPTIPWTGSTAVPTTAVPTTSIPTWLGTTSVALLFAGALAVSAARLARTCPGSTTAGTARLFRRSAGRPPSGRSLVWLDLVRWYRSPLVLSIDATTVVATVVLVLVVPRAAPAWDFLGLAVVVAAASGTAVMCRGVTRRADWAWATAALRRGDFVRTKLTAAGVAAGLPVAVCSVVVGVTGSASVGTLVAALPYALLAFSTSLWAGIALPVDETMGLSSATAIALALGLDAAVGAVLGALHLGAWSTLVVVVGSLAILAGAAGHLNRTRGSL